MRCLVKVDEDGNETVIGEESDSDTGVIKGEENPPEEKKTVKVKGKKKGGVPKKEPATAVK